MEANLERGRPFLARCGTLPWVQEVAQAMLPHCMPDNLGLNNSFPEQRVWLNSRTGLEKKAHRKSWKLLEKTGKEESW